MKSFFRGVSKRIDRLDAGQLREQYRLVTDEMDFLETLLRTIDRGIAVLDESGRAVFSNPAADALLGMSLADALPALDIPLGKASKRQLKVTYPDARWLEVQTMPMKAGTLVMLRDVTAEKSRSEEELRAGATRAVRDLASGVAHEIGNPLNALSLNLQIMERSETKEGELIATCRGEIARLDGILRGFLQALRPSKPNLAPGSAVEPLMNCLAALKGQLESRRITVTIDAPAALPQVALDRAQVEQVYFNLVKNALEAMKDDGRLAVTVSSDDEDVTVSLADTGEGMDAEQLAHLFEPYRTTKEHGNGLGLMISERIVRDHGGRIDVESEPGRGTTFAVRLPRLERRIRELEQN